MTEEKRILAEVARRRERAAELGLYDLLTLFCDHLVFLKDGLNPARVPESVTDVKATDITLGSDLIQSREISFGEKSYLFVFKQKDDLDPSGEPYSRANLLLINDSHTLFDLYCRGKDEQWIGRSWQPFRVEAFLEGPWIKEIKTFAQDTFNLSEDHKKQSQAERKKEELEDLKNKFGLS
jgi:hypothetical protein